MTVAELIKELEQLDQNERIIVSVKEHVETLFTTFDVYHKGDIQEIAFHMDGYGNNAYVLEVEDSFTELINP